MLVYDGNYGIGLAMRRYTLKERNDEIEALQAQLRSGGAASERAPAPSNNVRGGSPTPHVPMSTGELCS